MRYLHERAAIQKYDPTGLAGHIRKCWHTAGDIGQIRNLCSNFAIKWFDWLVERMPGNHVKVPENRIKHKIE